MIRSHYTGHNIIFIVGSPRSGTTWLQRLLSSHPKVLTGQESDIFDAYIGPQLRAWHRSINPQNTGRSAVGLGCYFLEEKFLKLLREYMLKLLEPMIGNLQPDEIFIEKTPSHALYIPEIMEMLPMCRIIHVLRDARDVVASLLAASKSWGTSWAPRTAKSAAVMWLRHVQAVQKSANRLTKKCFYEIRYEDLHSRSFEIMNDLTNRFINLDWSEEEIKEAIDYNKPEKAKETRIVPNITIGGEWKKITDYNFLKEPNGFIRKAQPGSWKEDLSLKEKFQVWQIARKMMVEVGYHWKLPWK